MESQKSIWNNIAKEWHKFKTEKNTDKIEFLKNATGNVLDLGSGSGRYLAKIKNGKMWLVDFSEEMINLAKKKAKKEKIPAEFFVADLTKLPFEDNFFDFAISMSSLHCLNKKQSEKAVKELYRVLKPKSKVKISVWNKNAKRFRNAKKEKYIAWRDKGKRYYYLFDEKEIHDLFKKAGFRIIEKIPPERNIVFVGEKN
ncbi:MAG: methyltransferase domain-containing protein [Nanoarchaeota archaeon]|nr:methyltransferase domain-containing protein [Nanoarchaeota archaeon]